MNERVSNRESSGQSTRGAELIAGPGSIDVGPVDAFVGRNELARRLGVHERTISRMVARGELPEPCMSHGGRPRWLWSFVADFCRARHERQVKIDQKLRAKLE